MKSQQCLSIHRMSAITLEFRNHTPAIPFKQRCCLDGNILISVGAVVEIPLDAQIVARNTSMVLKDLHVLADCWVYLMWFACGVCFF